MKHPNILLLEKLYADLTNGNISAVLESCADKLTFQVPGKSQLAGKYDKSTFKTGLIDRMKELSGGTFKTSVHDILASDLHGTVLATNQLVRDGKTVELRTVYVWRFEDGKPVAGYEYPRDLYQFDSIWS